MPGEIIAICKQNRRPQWLPHLTFAHVNGPTDLARWLGQRIRVETFCQVYFSLQLLLGSPVAIYPAFHWLYVHPLCCTLLRKQSPLGARQALLQVHCMKVTFPALLLLGLGKDHRFWPLSPGVGRGGKLYNYFAENWSFLTSKSPHSRGRTCSCLVKLQST